MKKYEKPCLKVLSLSANDALCACTYDVVGENMSPEIGQLLVSMGAVTQDQLQNPEYMKRTFAKGDDCVYEVDCWGYCKHGPSDQVVFNS